MRAEVLLWRLSRFSQGESVKHIVVNRYGGPEALVTEFAPEPVAGPGEVCIRVAAAGVSFTDRLLRAGTYMGGPKPPFTPGYAVAGVVEHVGAGCAVVQPGDSVVALLVWGGYAEKVCVSEPLAVRVPADIDPAVLVALAFPYMTAHQLIHRAAETKPEECALYHGAAGRVGIALLELARPAGLTVYGTAASRDCGVVAELGGVPIDYAKEDFLERVRSLPGGGVDVVFDGIGGRLSVRSFRALRRGGRLVLFGHHSTLKDDRRNRLRQLEWYAATAAVVAAGTLDPHRRVLGYRIAELRDRHPSWFEVDLNKLITLYRAGTVKPIIAARIPLSDARRAHEMLEQSPGPGQIVLVPHG